MRNTARHQVRLGIAALTALIAATTFAGDEKSEPKWERVSEEAGITIFRREVPGSDLIGFKGEGTIDAPMLRVGSVIMDHKRLHEWASHVEEARLLKRISDTEVIEYTHVGTPFILKDRDFVTRRKYRVDPASGEIHFEYKSDDYPEAPVTDHVRGNVMHSAFVLKSIDGGTRTQFTGEIHADPKGSVPKWMVNFFQKSWPRKTLDALRRQCKKGDVKDNAELAEQLKTP